MKKGLKNYIIYGLIVIVTIVLVVVLKNWYEIKKDKHTIKRMSSIVEIKEQDLDNYLTENENIIIYMSNSKKSELKEFEEEFNEYINKENLNKSIIYIDLNEVSDKFDEDLKNIFNINPTSSYLSVNFNEDENIIIVEESQLLGVLYNTPNHIKMEDVKAFLKGNEQ